MTVSGHSTRSRGAREVILCLLMLASCRLAAQGPRTATGHYTTSFETSSFVECGGSERWWVEGPALEAVDAFLRDQRGLPPDGPLEPLQDGTVFVTWRGDVSGSGEYGHLGAYDRLFQATDLLDIRSPGETDCEPAEY